MRGVPASNLSSCPPSFSFSLSPTLQRERGRAVGGGVAGEGSSGLSCTRATVLTMEKLTFAAFQTHVGNSTL